MREELEYFALPPRAGKGDDGAVVAKTDEKGRPNEALVRLKHDCADALLSRKSIFTALQRNINRENNLAEQHLIDMLCMRCVACLPATQHCPSPDRHLQWL